MIKTFEVNYNQIETQLIKPSKTKHGDSYVELRKLVNSSICYNGSKYVLVVHYEEINKFTGR